MNRVQIKLYGEDRAHLDILVPLIQRLCGEMHLDPAIQTLNMPSSGRGDRGDRVVNDLKKFLRDMTTPAPDILILARDANCKGYVHRRDETQNLMKAYPYPIVYAIPDPHIERWLLLDSQAFKQCLGKGCDLPDYKCERDRYKSLLATAVSESLGFIPDGGGLEYAPEIVSKLDILRCSQIDDSFKRFCDELRSKLQEHATQNP